MQLRNVKKDKNFHQTPSGRLGSLKKRLHKTSDMSINTKEENTSKDKKIVPPLKQESKRELNNNKRSYKRRSRALVAQESGPRNLKYLKVKLIPIFQNFISSLYKKNEILNNIKIAKLKKDSYQKYKKLKKEQKNQLLRCNSTLDKIVNNNDNFGHSYYESNSAVINTNSCGNGNEGNNNTSLNGVVSGHSYLAKNGMNKVSGDPHFHHHGHVKLQKHSAVYRNNHNNQYNQYIDLRMELNSNQVYRDFEQSINNKAESINIASPENELINPFLESPEFKQIESKFNQLNQNIANQAVAHHTKGNWNNEIYKRYTSKLNKKNFPVFQKQMGRSKINQISCSFYNKFISDYYDEFEPSSPIFIKTPKSEKEGTNNKIGSNGNYSIKTSSNQAQAVNISSSINTSKNTSATDAFESNGIIEKFLNLSKNQSNHLPQFFNDENKLAEIFNYVNNNK